MKALILYVVFVAIGGVVAATVGYYVELQVSSAASLIVFLALFFANFAISWIAVILIMDGSLRDAQGRQSQLDIEKSGRAETATRLGWPIELIRLSVFPFTEGQGGRPLRQPALLRIAKGRRIRPGNDGEDIVKRAIGIVAALAVAGGIAVRAVDAHHAMVMYDRLKTVTLNGTVVELQWTNPHVFLIVNGKLKDDDQPAVWRLETSGPTNLARQTGWSPTALRPGDRVSVEINPLREGDEKSVRLTRVVLTETPARSCGRPTRTSTSSARSEFGHPPLRGRKRAIRAFDAAVTEQARRSGR